MLKVSFFNGALVSQWNFSDPIHLASNDLFGLNFVYFEYREIKG